MTTKTSESLKLACNALAIALQAKTYENLYRVEKTSVKLVKINRLETKKRRFEA